MQHHWKETKTLQWFIYAGLTVVQFSSCRTAEGRGRVFRERQSNLELCLRACVCAHVCVSAPHLCKCSAGTQKLRCGPRSRREEGEVIVQARGLLLASDSSNLKGAASEVPLEAFLSFPSLSFGKPGWVISQLYPARTLLQRKRRALTSDELWGDRTRSWGWRSRGGASGVGGAGGQLKLSGCRDHWPFPSHYLCYSFYSLEVVFFKMLRYV